MTATVTTLVQPLTVERARELLVAAIEEKGADYVYPESEKAFNSCMYLTYEGQQPTGPSCLVGDVLIRAGVELNAIINVEGKSAWNAVPLLIPSTDERVVAALDAAQYEQDAGGTWGEALARFDEHFDHKEAA